TLCPFPSIIFCVVQCCASLPDVVFPIGKIFHSFPELDFRTGTIFSSLPNVGLYSFCLVQTIRRNTGEATNLFCLMQNNMLRTTCKQYAPYLAGVFFVENIDYAEIQVELDGAVEERRTCLVDRAAVRHP